MSSKQVPSGMISVEEFSKQEWVSKKKVIEKIQNGIYVGKYIDGQWFVKSSSSSTPKQGSNEPMSSSDYKSSIGVAKFVSAAGWVVCGLAFFFAFSAFSANAGIGLIVLAPALGIFLGGLILVIAGQTSRAVMDNANYSKQILEEMRKNA